MVDDWSDDTRVKYSKAAFYQEQRQLEVERHGVYGPSRIVPHCVKLNYKSKSSGRMPRMMRK